jgi:hypothetical protein
MEKKPTNTYGGISKSMLKSLNRNYLAEPEKDLNRINEIMSVFIEGELSSIETILNSGEILNFKDQTNQTLIHAILKNVSPNITEENKLSIIRRLVDEKNVSTHTMTNYNKNPLHLACEKGYSLIISYLIEKDCDQTLIDNYGNAPIHYLVDKFVHECGENELYSQANKQVKLVNSLDLKKTNEILKNQSMLVLFKLFSSSDDFYYSKDIGESGLKIINVLKKFVSNKVQSSLPLIYELIDGKINEITKIFIEPNDSTETKYEKAKNKIFSINNEVLKIYKIDFEFSNIVWKNFLTEQNFKIKNIKVELKKEILKQIEKMKLIFQTQIINILEEVITNKVHLYLTKFMSGTMYLNYFLNTYNNRDKIKYDEIDNKGNIVKQLDLDILFLYNDENGNLVELKDKKGDNLNLQGKSYKKIGDKQTELNDLINNKLLNDNFQIFLNGIGNINNLDEINVIKNNINLPYNENKYKFFYNNRDYTEYIDVIEGVYTDTSGNQYWGFVIPNEITPDDKKQNFKNYTKEIKKINSKFQLLPNEILKIQEQMFKKPNNYFIYSPIGIITSIINGFIYNIFLKFNKLSDNVNNNLEFNKLLQEFYLFDIKYFTEIIFKIINNLIILEKYLDDIDVNEIEKANISFENIFRELQTSGDINVSVKKIINRFEYFIKQVLINKDTINNIKLKNYTEKFDEMYSANTNILDIFSGLTNIINEYYSYEQLEKYNEFISENIIQSSILSKPISINNTIFNNYSFKMNYPKKYKQYKKEFFKIKEDFNLYEKGKGIVAYKNETIELKDFLINPNYKKDYIEKIYKYVNTCDFNIFYLDLKTNFQNKIIAINNTASGKLKEFKLKDFIYEVDKYKFDGSREYKFSRGYDMLKYDINGNQINMIGIVGKEEKKTLCDMKFLETNNVSDFDSTNNSIKENADNIVSWMIKDKFEIKDIDDMNTYIITEKLTELINIIIYMIYEKINQSPEISNTFFDKQNLIFVNEKNPSETKNIYFGIDLENVGLDKLSKTNIEETLDVIRSNPEQKQGYLLDNIKSFVKIILYEQINKEIFKIMDEIKIKKWDKQDNKEKYNQILTSETIDTFNKTLSKMDIKYQNDFWSRGLAEYIKDSSPSPILEFVLINLSGNNININNLSQEQNRTIGSKCLNVKKTDELMRINRLNYRVLDTNGNTILIRLIEQFNIYGIKKLLENKKVLSTYKNNNMETPINYLSNLMNNIGLDNSIESLKQRIERYSIALENTIKSSIQFNGIELVDSLNLVSQIILNSIYLFNEVLWLKIYSYPMGWNAEDKNNLKSILGFEPKAKEKLLINSFNKDDENKYFEEEKKSSENKLSSYIEILNKEIEELKNKLKSLELTTEEDIINKSEDKIKKINKEIEEKEKIIENYKKINEDIKNKSGSSTDNIINIINSYDDKLLDIKNLSIEWSKYKELLNNLDNKYLKIISILDIKCEKKTIISNHLIKIFSLISIDDDKNNNELIRKYFKYIFVPIFNDYWDLDRYEDSEYNTTNYSIIQILKINVVGVIKNELINSLTKYMAQINTNKDKIQDVFNKIKGNNDLVKSIQIYLTKSLVIKLGLSNPDKANPQISIDEHKAIIINTLNKIVGGQLDETSREEINKILEFNKFVCENIGLNCYEEIIKILYDGKKISMYYEIYEELDKAINE